MSNDTGGASVVLEVLEGKDLIPPDKVSTSEPSIVILQAKNKKKIKPISKVPLKFENVKITFVLGKDLAKEEMKIEFYLGKVLASSAVVQISTLLPFNTEHDKWIPLVEKEETKGEIHVRMYLFPKRDKELRSRKYPTQLFKAVEEGDLQLLIKCNDDPKIDPNTQDEDGWTALHHACNKWENEHVINLLLRHPAVRVDIVNVDGNTPLHTFTQKFKNPSCVETFNLLMQKGANVNAKNYQQETPLHKAVINPRIRMLLVELLLKAGAKVNECVKGGTPLHYAVQLGRTDLVTILISNGADLTIKDYSGRTPIDLCKQFKYDAVLQKMQDFVALGEFLETMGASSLKREFFKRQLFKWKLKDMSEQALAKLGIEIPAGLSLKLFRSFKEITDVDPSKPAPGSAAAASAAASAAISIDPEKQRAVLDDLISKGAWKIEEGAIEFTQLLGTGSAGEVYKGLYTYTLGEGTEAQKIAMPVAIKILKLAAGKELEAFQLEFKVISAIKSPYIVMLYGAVPSDKLKLVMELCARGSLYDVLSKSPFHIGWSEFFTFCEHMMRGLIVIHTHNPQILHRDLKSLNFLVSEDWIVKCCDFGLARFDTGGSMDTLTKLRGTFAYSAPEVYFGERYTAKSDIYSMGILLWEVVYRVIYQKYQRPFEEFPKLKLDWQIILKTATENLRPTMPPSTPLPISILIKQMIGKDQAGRPDAKEVLQQILDMKDHYETHKSEWESAIVGEKTGQPIVFPTHPLSNSSPNVGPNQVVSPSLTPISASTGSMADIAANTGSSTTSAALTSGMSTASST